MSYPGLPASAYAELGLPEETVKIIMNPTPKKPSIASPNVLQDASEPEQRPEPNQSTITLYAELLLHIRTITLFASLRSLHTRETTAKLSTDGCRITVTHEGQTATIRLPIQADGTGDAALSLPAKPPSKELTLRLQIEEQEGTNLLGSLLSEERKANVVPWSGSSLNKSRDIGIDCKACGAVIVRAGKITEWRDLPNENWAEMMDFWHCHKPDEHHLHDHTQDDAIGRKGYAAGNRLQAADSLGFVDLTSFLLYERNCEGAKASERSLECNCCGHAVGIQDSINEGWRIWKWCISIPSQVASQSFSTSQWISVRLLYLIENQGVRKFHVHAEVNDSNNGPVPSLLLWVFTPDLFYSSSVESEARNDPTRSMKVFYQSQTWAPPKPGDVESASVETVAFAPELYQELEQALVESQALLPFTARKFQGWEVGLLPRFDIGDVAEQTNGSKENAEEAEPPTGEALTDTEQSTVEETCVP